MNKQHARPSRWWLIQLVASVLVLGLFIRSVEPEQLRSLPSRVHLLPLLGALLVKGLALLLHDIRLWYILPQPRPPLIDILRVGLVSGVVNLVSPGRAGDVLNVALLRTRCGIPLGTATATMGLVGVLEAAAFGTLLLAGLTFGAANWEQLIGAEAHDQAFELVGLGTGLGLLGLTAVAIIGRRLAAREPESKPDQPGAIQVLQDAFTQTGAALASPQKIVFHVTLAYTQVLGMVFSFAVALPAVGVSVPTPFIAAAMIMGLSAVASVVLPPGYGAGPAAAALTVLHPLGVQEAEVLAYAGAWWVLSQLPALVLGLPSMWSLGVRWSDTETSGDNGD
ncbi:MAG TPA: hypothetical protein DFR83_01875 [Deltaproteobacteria bacterium]|nr:hypothetical protein [Deltaproteobacteria bacterium]